MQSDDEHVLALLATDLDAHFPQLMLAYQHQLYTFAFRLVGNRQDAEEIVQEAFTRAYYALEEYPAQRIRALKLRRWLYTITRNLFYNRMRKATLPTLPLDESEDSPLLELEDAQCILPEVELEKDETRNELGRLVHTLPERYRETIVLYYFENFSYYEIAELLQQPVGTVKANVHRAIRLLRNTLGTQTNGVR